jgi:hypothetical protein
MADRRGTSRTSEVYADHAFTGGVDLDDIYGKKKASQTSSGTAGAGAGGPYGDSTSAAGPYGGPQYSSPYVKPAGKPAGKPSTTEDDYSDSYKPTKPASKPATSADDNSDSYRPLPTSSGYGRHEESRPSHQNPSAYGEEDVPNLSRPEMVNCLALFPVTLENLLHTINSFGVVCNVA